MLHNSNVPTLCYRSPETHTNQPQVVGVAPTTAELYGVEEEELYNMDGLVSADETLDSLSEEGMQTGE